MFVSFQADGQPELFTGVRLMINQLSQTSFSMQHQCYIISKKHLTDENLHYLCSVVQASDVEYLSISCGAEVDALSTVCENVLEDHGEEYLKESQC